VCFGAKPTEIAKTAYIHRKGKEAELGYFCLSQGWQRRELCSAAYTLSPQLETVPRHGTTEPALSFFQLLSTVIRDGTFDSPTRNNPNYICTDQYI